MTIDRLCLHRSGMIAIVLCLHKQHTSGMIAVVLCLHKQHISGIIFFLSCIGLQFRTSLNLVSDGSNKKITPFLQTYPAAYGYRRTSRKISCHSLIIHGLTMLLRRVVGSYK